MENKVYLVGAGPGDPELLTIRAKRTIERADVILYDGLVGRELFGGLSKRAKWIYAGRRTESAGQRQKRIYGLGLRYHK